MNGGLFDEPYVMHVIEPVWLPVDYGLFPSPFVVPFPTERSRRTTLSGARDVWRTWHRRDHCRHRHRDARIPEVRRASLVVPAAAYRARQTATIHADRCWQTPVHSRTSLRSTRMCACT